MISTPITADLEKAIETAGKRARAKADFLRHALVFFCINLFFMAIDAAASPDSFWFMWPLSAWGLILAGQAAIAWRPAKKRGAKKEEAP